MVYQTNDELDQLMKKHGGFRVRKGNEWYIKLHNDVRFVEVSTGVLVLWKDLAGAENPAVKE